jgi:hypothetical protein
MAILPAALFIYGWTLETQVHWMAPAVATGLAGFCLSTATIPVMNYLVDIFGDLSASPIAAVLPLRLSSVHFYLWLLHTCMDGWDTGGRTRC